MAPNPEFLNKVSETFKDASETIVVVGCYNGHGQAPEDSDGSARAVSDARTPCCLAYLLMISLPANMLQACHVHSYFWLAFRGCRAAWQGVANAYSRALESAS